MGLSNFSFKTLGLIIAFVYALDNLKGLLNLLKHKAKDEKGNVNLKN
jgi:hypothetical protein